MPQCFIPFNLLNRIYSTHICVHFYGDDYRYGMVWNNFEFYLKKLAPYEMVISTDDSVYMDAPLALNMWSVYRNRVFTAVGQKFGLNVIPSFSCGDPIDINLYCDGLPDGGCIAVSAMGTNCNESKRKIFRYCVREMCRIKKPDMLMVYGNRMDLGLNIPIFYIPTYVEFLRKNYNHGRQIIK